MLKDCLRALTHTGFLFVGESPKELPLHCLKMCPALSEPAVVVLLKRAQDMVLAVTL